MVVFLEITALLLQDHAILIQVATYMAPYPGIPQCSSITIYRICLRNLRTFFFILAAEKSGCVKYSDFFLWRS